MPRSLNVETVRVALLWAAGNSAPAIAKQLGCNLNTVTSRVRRARLALGESFVPHEKPSGGIRQASPLDRLEKEGDSIQVRKSELGSRPNVHQNAATRGWRVRVASKGDYYLVTAVARMPDPATPAVEVPNPLTRLRAVGDEIRCAPREIGQRTNFYAKARAAGWKLSLRRDGEGYIVRAVARL